MQCARVPLVPASSDGTIIAWDARRHSVRTVLRGHSAWVDALVLSSDGRHLFSGGGDGRVVMWDTEKGEEKKKKKKNNNNNNNHHHLET